MQSLIAAPREALDADVVTAALALEHNPQIRHGVDVLDTAGLFTGDTLDVERGSVSWAYRAPERSGFDSTSAAEVRRTAELVVAGDVDFNLVARHLRIWTEIDAPTGEAVRFHLGVFVVANPSLVDDGILLRRPLRLADKTYRYANRVLTDPLTVPAATNVIDFVIDRLGTEFDETAFAITVSDVELTEARVFEAGMTELALFNALLEVAGYDQLTADENGRPRSIPLADLADRGPEHRYAPADGKILTAGVIEPLLPTLPNVLRFVARVGDALPAEGAGIATRTNQSTGPGSIDARGEEVHLEVQVEAETQPELEAIADADAQRYFAGGGLRFSGSVALNPRHSDRDVVELVKPRLGLSGIWVVTSWQYPLEPIDSERAVTMPITCEARV